MRFYERVTILLLLLSKPPQGVSDRWFLIKILRKIFPVLYFYLVLECAPNLLLYILLLLLLCYYLLLLCCLFSVKFYVRRLLSHMNYHQIVSINRPLGYGPNALPLRHDDYMCPKAFGFYQSPSASISRLRLVHRTYTSQSPLYSVYLVHILSLIC